MPQEMIGRRVKLAQEGQDPVIALTQAGDYCGPVTLHGKVCVFFLLPIAKDEDAHGGARSLHHVESPPHRFIENPDGTLTIRESILSRGYDREEVWHGFLTHGEWHKDSRPV